MLFCRGLATIKCRTIGFHSLCVCLDLNDPKNTCNLLHSALVYEHLCLMRTNVGCAPHNTMLLSFKLFCHPQLLNSQYVYAYMLPTHIHTGYVYILQLGSGEETATILV